MKKNKVLENWEKATQEITEYFVEKYYKGYKPDWYWIGDTIGYIIDINDCFFSLERIVEAIRHNASEKKLFDFYDLELDFATKNKPMEINFENYLKLK